MAGKTLDPHLWNLENLFKSIYNVPVYQRPYSWDKEQIDVLLSDIIEAYKSESKNEGYYTGNIIVFDKNDKINGLITKYDIIDGKYDETQQDFSRAWVGSSNQNYYFFSNRYDKSIINKY